MTFAYQINDGKVVGIFPKCEAHNFYYKGRPPLTTGCKSCWEVYYFSQFARTPKKDQGELLDILESAIHHAAEHIEKGTWDFIPDAHAAVEVQPDVPEEYILSEVLKDVHEA